MFDSFNCFSSNSDQSAPQLAGGGINASMAQANHSQNKRFSVGGDRWSTSLCCSIPIKLANILRFCFCCYCRCSYCDDDGSHHSKNQQRHKNGCSNRRSSFNRDRRLSFPEINVTSTQLIGNSNVSQQQNPELLPSTSQESPQATIRKEIVEERQTISGNQSYISNKTENNSNNKLDYHQDDRRPNSSNIINQLLFDLFKRRKSVNNVPVYCDEAELPSAHNNHPKPLSPLMQLSASTLSSSISNVAANNDSYNDCDLIPQNNKTFELLESKKSLNDEIQDYHHPHPQYYHDNSMVPSGSSGLKHNTNVLLPSPSSSKNVTPTKSSFSPPLNVGRAFKLKKTIAPQSTSTSTTVMNEQQHKLRMDVSSKRLMKEIGDLMRRQQNKQLTANFSVELIDESLYEWNIKIYEFDKESQIYMDMQQYQIPYVQLHAMFPETYPFDPPFIRVVAPYIERGYVMEGGAICLELLTKTGWTSAYTMESVIIQLMASFVKGQAIIKATKDVSKCFTKKSAVNSFRHIVRIHDKHGWVDTPLYEG